MFSENNIKVNREIVRKLYRINLDNKHETEIL